MNRYGLDPHTEAYRAASFGDFPAMTAEQERAVWQQAFLEQKMRADSLFRAWVTMVVFALVTNISWAAWVILK